MKKILIFCLLFISFSPFHLFSQKYLEIQPLFEYPVAPEEMESLEERCSFLVKHFWDNFNFKQKTAVDQHALNDAFQVYVSALQYSVEKENEQSLNILIKQISGNPILLMQFTKAAEENLYGPRAEIWSDYIYLKFLDAVEKNKKLNISRKTKYIDQAKALRMSAVGNAAPSFEFIDKNGETKNYFSMSTPTLLIFGWPDDTDWRLSRLKMDSNFKLTELLEKGKLNVLYIIPEYKDNWQEEISNYNKKWTLGISPEIRKTYDIRINPSVYLIGADGKIVNKTISIGDAVEKALNLVN
ncbi:MAG: DUF5106 domain-containing protein [Muribaculaceae bacterium]|nr:DUF5106 domain-containing protein [Muribaculaceae bacterium]